MSDEFDFELPPLPKIKRIDDTAQPTVAAATYDLPPVTTPAAATENAAAVPNIIDETPEPPPKKMLSAADILAAPDNSGDVVIPKDKVDTSSVKNITSTESLERTMAETQRALELITENSSVPFDRISREKESDKKADEIFSNPTPIEAANEEVTADSIQLSDMDELTAPMNAGADEAARALKNMVMLDDMSMAMDAPTLDEMSSEYTTDRKKSINDNFAGADTLSNRQKKMLKERMHEEIYRRPDNFSKKTGRLLEDRLKAENRLKKAKKGLLLNLLTIVMILACAALTYIGLHEYNELFTVLAAGTLISGLMLLIRSKSAKTFTVVYLALNILALAVPGLVMMILQQRDFPTDNFDQLVTMFTVCIVLSGIALFMLSTSKLISIYFTTDNEGREK